MDAFEVDSVREFSKSWEVWAPFSCNKTSKPHQASTGFRTWSPIFFHFRGLARKYSQSRTSFIQFVKTMLPSLLHKIIYTTLTAPQDQQNHPSRHQVPPPNRFPYLSFPFMSIRFGYACQEYDAYSFGINGYIERWPPDATKQDRLIRKM